MTNLLITVNIGLAAVRRALTVAICAVMLYSCNGDMDQLTVSDSGVVWWTAPSLIAEYKGIYKKNDLEVFFTKEQNGLLARNALLSGAADIGAIATTPLASGAFQKNDLIILCSYVESDYTLSVVTRNNGDTILYSKPEPPIAVVGGTISELYLYNYLKKYFPEELDNLSDNVVSLSTDFTQYLQEGVVRSVSVWEPFGTNIAWATDYKINRAPDVYTNRMYIVTTPKVLREKRRALQKYVKSIEVACEFLNKEPKQSKEIINKFMDGQNESMENLFDKVNFSVRYDYDKMKELILLDGAFLTALKRTPQDATGEYIHLDSADVAFYFKHDFKPLKWR